MSDAVAPLRYAVGRDGITRAHRPSCTKVPAKGQVAPADVATPGDVRAASCCKPRLPAPVVETAPPPTSPAAVIAQLNHRLHPDRPLQVVSDAPQAVEKAPSGAPRSTRGERGLEARAVAKAKGKRGPGVKVTDEELARYIAKVRRIHPTSSCSDELEVAYWMQGYAVSRSRWDAAWDGASLAASVSAAG